MAEEPKVEQVLIIDGQEYNADDLTFREQRDMRKTLRHLMDDSTGDIEDASGADFYAALIYTVKKRENPELDIEEVLDWRLSDFLKDRPTSVAPTQES